MFIDKGIHCHWCLIDDVNDKANTRHKPMRQIHIGAPAVEQKFITCTQRHEQDYNDNGEQ